MKFNRKPVDKPVNPKMATLTKKLREKKESIIHHPGIIKIENERKYNALKNSVIAKAHPTEFTAGSDYIRKILKFKQLNPILFTVGKLAPQIIKEYPELRKPETIKSIMIATGNPNLSIEKIDLLVNEMFADPKQVDANVISFIRLINKKNYGYLLSFKKDL